MRARFLGKDPESQVGQSPTLFATDRTDRVTYIAQGWKVTDPEALADIGPVPEHETLSRSRKTCSRCTLAAPARRGSAEPAHRGRVQSVLPTFAHTAFRLEVA